MLYNSSLKIILLAHYFFFSFTNIFPSPHFTQIPSNNILLSASMGWLFYISSFIFISSTITIRLMHVVTNDRLFKGQKKWHYAYLKHIVCLLIHYRPGVSLSVYYCKWWYNKHGSQNSFWLWSSRSEYMTCPFIDISPAHVLFLPFVLPGFCFWVSETLLYGLKQIKHCHFCEFFPELSTHHP